ncbi:retrovirus-related pol polyprotein from transposon TNT 1-94 [Tanacetum coccineum]|uniref:Retrovirus-related pol polyprotein from transposon TNT 1-94 n=1 Tax=Tanacetum coccineum TaxID=301880 RepID=A0ABQ5HLR6_9ASTR
MKDIMISHFTADSNSPTVSNASSIVFSICPSNDSDGELRAVSDASSTHYSTLSINDRYSFERKPCFVCGSLSHLIKDCDYYEKKMAREVALKSKRVVHTDVRQATPAWTNTNRVNKANQFTPRLGRENVNTGYGNVSSGSVHVNSGTQFKSGASRFNTGKQHVNSGSVHVNSGTQFKSGASRFNTGKQHVNLVVDSSTEAYGALRVRVDKPQNKTPYELLFGHKPILSYIRPFGCHVTILNTLSPLGKFDGKSDEGFLVGYSVNSKAFRVYNLVTKRVEVNLHVNFLKEKPNVQGIGHRWMFDLDYLTDSMNYIPVSLQNQANPAGSKEVIDIDEQTDEAAELMVVSSTSRKAAVSENIATKKIHPQSSHIYYTNLQVADDIML